MVVEITGQSGAGAHEAPVSEGTAAPDAAAIYEEIAFEGMRFSQGKTVFRTGRKAAVAAEEAFLVATDAVHTAEVEHFS